MIKVLLVEDNPVDAQLTQDLLAEWRLDQFDISHAPLLADGLAKLSRGRFDVVLLDLSLPDTQGLSTVTQVLATSPGVPVVVLSGHDDHPLALQALQHGAQDYLVKGQGGEDFLARSILYAIERKRAQERLTYLAQYDQLTGMINRTLFRDRLVHAMARSKRKDQPLAIMLLDLDRFKTVNDSLGHDVGDQLLKAVAERLTECVREVDTVARMGGDEFTAVLEGISGEADVAVVANRIVESIGTPFELGAHRVSIGASIGITLYPLDDQDIDELLRHADKAMYAAKHLGGSRFQFHSPADPPLPSRPTQR
ncbi:MAG: putative Signal transduction response regulator, receiver and diguanylate cyclase domain [Nitrospira sp.]|jgi:diguanylate cyclase (GGDEF)-like protein|nr:putative Signal transduction response regulator, receiver and diguanylate cyclase domain [Nitrospira sp.]